LHCYKSTVLPVPHGPGSPGCFQQLTLLASKSLLSQQKYRSSLVERSGGIFEMHILGLRGYYYFNINWSHLSLTDEKELILVAKPFLIYLLKQ
jgi:hypothetical protein